MVNDDQLHTVVANAPLIAVAIDKAGVYRLSEGEALAELRLAPGELVGRSVFEVHADQPEIIENVRRALAGETFTSLATFGPRVFEGHYRPSVGADNSVVGMTAILIDVTERVRLETLREQSLAEERRRSHIDSLTGVLNHAATIEALSAALSQDDVQRLSLAMVDIDGLKAANDTWGHQAGDAVLLAVARALSRDDAIVGRYGGDEFLAILAGADLPEAERYRDAVVEEVARTSVRDDRTGASIPIAMSFGFAVYPDEAVKLEDLVKLADGGMYASRRGRRAESDAEALRERLGSESAARLVGEIVPLLTAPGTREEKLRLVAHQLSVGAGYEAVNFEVSGEDAEPGASWEGAYSRGTRDSVESWVREQSQTTDHPLGRAMEQARSPIFIDDLGVTELLTESERDLLAATGLQSGLVVPMIWHEQLVGMLSVASKEPSAFSPWDAHFLTAVASQVTAIVFMTTLVEELQTATAHLTRAHSETVMMLASAAEAHDHTTGRHLQRVRLLTEALSLELGYSEDRSHQLGLAAVLHDIGKIRVPDSVLTSAAALTDEEWVIMRQHTIWGSDFLDGRHGFDLAAIVARAHHERWDGGGYPTGLKGEEIPEAAAITSVADTFDAMTNDRPYRFGRPVAEAVREIVSCSGTQFSPRVVEALVRLFDRGAVAFLDSESRRKAA
jgi:diguanylate cyclase (GGDEF)-like protein